MVVGAAVVVMLKLLLFLSDVLTFASLGIWVPLLIDSYRNSVLSAVFG